MQQCSGDFRKSKYNTDRYSYKKVYALDCIVVIGMGRSGTSLLSQILQAKGVWFGEDTELVGQTPINIYGNREHIEIQRIHRELLTGVFGVKEWLFLGKLAEDWHKHPNVIPYKYRLKEELHKLRSKIPHEAKFGFKDPRTTMLLPLWKDIFEEEGITPSYVLCMRDPSAVYKSLVRSGEVLNYRTDQDVPEQTIINIWKQYNYNARKYATISCIIQFEDWFNGNRFVQDFDLSDALKLPMFSGLELIDNKEKHF